MSELDFGIECGNCGSIIEDEEYDRTGTDEYCDECPELQCDPRSKAFGQCECEPGTCQ